MPYLIYTQKEWLDAVLNKMELINEVNGISGQGSVETK
jgi:hypothetical protein